MEKTVCTLAVYNVIITHATDLTDDAYLDVNMDFMVNCVIKVMFILDLYSDAVSSLIFLNQCTTTLLQMHLII